MVGYSELESFKLKIEAVEKEIEKLMAEVTNVVNKQETCEVTAKLNSKTVP